MCVAEGCSALSLSSQSAAAGPHAPPRRSSLAQRTRCCWSALCLQACMQAMPCMSSAPGLLACGGACMGWGLSLALCHAQAWPDSQRVPTMRAPRPTSPLSQCRHSSRFLAGPHLRDPTAHARESAAVLRGLRCCAARPCRLCRRPGGVGPAPGSTSAITGSVGPEARRYTQTQLPKVSRATCVEAGSSRTTCAAHRTHPSAVVQGQAWHDGRTQAL